MTSNRSRGFFRMAVAAPLCFMFSISAFAQDEPASMNNLTISCEITNDCSPIGVAIQTKVHVDHPTPGHDFTLKYQLRILQDRRSVGPILGNAAFPRGVALDLDQSIGKARYRFGNFNLEGDVDITRDKLREMTNFPTNQPSSEVLIGFCCVENKSQVLIVG
ncbi:hypothetical protein KOR42_27690 [Thalassoglobus neptunius]|uniref:Uncharacterized protein n=1 Tax=Thalassoglobus neptunius TaxID=1938619 RepID=A0A5C5X0B9_9PLAN|nr:hypothetical protein [Thalassoglobus neptunius]TWT55642.1 hypothetical protein KOR42_27690 [Thalassoglobus neptunius]